MRQRERGAGFGRVGIKIFDEGYTLVILPLNISAHDEAELSKQQIEKITLSLDNNIILKV